MTQTVLTILGIEQFHLAVKALGGGREVEQRASDPEVIETLAGVLAGTLIAKDRNPLEIAQRAYSPDTRIQGLAEFMRTTSRPTREVHDCLSKIATDPGQFAEVADAAVGYIDHPATLRTIAENTPHQIAALAALAKISRKT